MADTATSAPYPWERSYPEGLSWHTPIPPQSMTALFEASAARNAARPCIDFLDKKYTYAQTAAMVDRVAKGLQGLGVGKGTRVGLFLPNTPYFVFFYFGILKAGGTVVNFNPLYAEREIVKQIQDADLDIMVTLDLPQLYDKLAKVRGEAGLRTLIMCPMADVLPFPKNLLYPFVRRKDVVRYRDDGAHLSFHRLVANDGRPAPVVIDPLTDVAVLQYTGGTTGVPKGAMLTHANIAANTVQAALWFATSPRQPVDGRERILGALPLFHVFAMTAVMNLAIQAGAEMILLPRFDVNQVLQTIDKKRPTQFPAVPTIYTAINACKDRAKYDLSSLNTCVSGGAPLPLDVRLTFEANTGCSLVEGYGLSESAPVATVNPMGGSRENSIGLPVPGTVIEIISTEDGQTPMPQGARGEVCIRGPQVMKGYWKRDDETAVALRDGRLHTGDVGYIDEDGFVYIVDRIKDLILAGGYNVYPRNVEEAIYQHPAVAECIVLGVPDPYRGQTVKAYIKLLDGHDLTPEALNAFLKDKLSAIEMPKLVEFRDELPKTMIGKLSRKALLDEIEAAKKQAPGTAA